MAAHVLNTATATSSTSGNNASDSVDISNSTTSTVANSKPETRRVEDYFTPAGIEEGKRSGILRVAALHKEEIAFDYRLIPIYGDRPEDEPFCLEFTYEDYDRRTLPPFTLRYRAKEGTGHLHQPGKHDEVTAAIWDYLRECLPKVPSTDLQPAIVFQPGIVPAIDVRFRAGATEVFRQARNKLVKIEVEAPAGAQNDVMHFELEGWSNSLPSDVMPIDILHFPSNQGFTDELVASLQDMVGKVGKLVGAAFVFQGPFREQGMGGSANITRMYVELSRKSMSLEHSELLELLPTQFRWKGFRCSLQYSGRPRSIERISKDYPLDNKEEGNTTGSTSATHLSSTSSSNNSSGGASKKRKSGET